MDSKSKVASYRITKAGKYKMDEQPWGIQHPSLQQMLMLIRFSEEKGTTFKRIIDSLHDRSWITNQDKQLLKETLHLFEFMAAHADTLLQDLLRSHWIEIV